MGQPQYGQQLPGYGAPQVDPTVLAWFQSVDQDRSGRISALELQQVSLVHKYVGNNRKVNETPTPKFKIV